MKKAYAKPIATKVDFEYEDNVIAQSAGGDTGTQGRPTHPTDCQYISSSTCTLVHSLGHTCEIEPQSLNLYL